MFKVGDVIQINVPTAMGNKEIGIIKNIIPKAVYPYYIMLNSGIDCVLKESDITLVNYSIPAPKLASDDVTYWDLDKTINTPSHSCTFQQYTGLMQSFEFCTQCDKKR